MTKSTEELYRCTACSWLGLYEEVTHIQFGGNDGVDKCPQCEFVETVMLYQGPALHLCEKCGDHYAEAGDEHCASCNKADHDTLLEQQADKELADAKRRGEAIAGGILALLGVDKS